MIAVILSGTGSDGVRGVVEVNAAGGLALAQSPESAQFDGMPNSAIATGFVDRVGNRRCWRSPWFNHMQQSDGTLPLDEEDDGPTRTSSWGMCSTN
jgi:two-component system CheB/CheR fusion protein